jgi:hypothetical protein
MGKCAEQTLVKRSTNGQKYMKKIPMSLSIRETQIKTTLRFQSECLSSKTNKQTNEKNSRCQWLTPIILDTQEAEIRRIKVRSQPGQIVLQEPILKNPSQK